MLKKWIINYKDVILYLFFGGCTTGINIIVYWICARFLGIGVTTSTVIAWFFAVLFAFFTNKSWVFGSKSWENNIVKREIFSFFICRIATGIIDVMIMIVTVGLLHWNDIIMKVISNVIVIVLNYMASRFIIFKKDNKS